MTTPKITGSEPYYPSTLSIYVKPSGEMRFKPGITIKQKFIADYAIKNRHLFGNSIDLFIEAEETFQAYLKIINGE